MPVSLDRAGVVGARPRGTPISDSTRRMLLRRARFLRPEDQSLLRLWLDQTHTCRALSQLFGLSAGSVSRRVNGLARRLREPIVSALIDFPGTLPALHREVGIRWFLLRQPMRQIALQTGQTPREVRGVLAYLNGWWETQERFVHDEAGRERARGE